MKHIIKFRWLVGAAWLIAALCLFIFAPDLQQLVQEKGQMSAPEDSPSVQASKLLDKMNPNSAKDNASAVLVFHEKNGISKSEKDSVGKAIEILKSKKDQLGVSDILDFRDDQAIADQTVSKDKKTIMVPFNVSLDEQEIDESRHKIYNAVKSIKVEHYLTGEEYISQDIVKNSEEGLKKTEIITVGLILVILFVVFKSFIAPLIPLLTVGISYLAAQGIVSILADTTNFPLSTFTQIFMVAVMFGIGTDYCILLISRFKEEMEHQDSVKDAVIATYQSSSKTILFAGLAVLIGFSTIGLSKFSLYQSAVAVAVGVAAVLLALFTLVPFFMVLLGKKLFWPFDKSISHKESGLWIRLGNFSWARPLWSLIIILMVTVPLLLTYNGTKSYNSLAELSSDYDSVKGFNAIADSFGPGQTMPATVVLQSKKPVEETGDYQDVEDITNLLAQMEGVKEVRSATRPAGDMIADFKVDNQTDALAKGIGQSNKGLKKIQSGLSDASSELKKANPQLEDAKSGVSQLMKGTNDAKNGIGDLSKALSDIQKGIFSGADGAGKIKNNLQGMKDNLDQTIDGNRKILAGYEQFASQIKDFSTIGNDIDLDQLGDPSQLNDLISTLQGGKKNVTTMHDKAVKSNPELAKDNEFQTSYQTTIGQLDTAIDGVKSVQEEMKNIRQQYGKLGNVKDILQQKVVTPLDQLNRNFKKNIDGQQEISNGIGKMLGGINDLQSGLNQAGNGQGKVVGQLPSLRDGLAKIYGGQKDLKQAFTDMQDQLGELSNGLNDSSDGLKKISGGLTDVQEYLKDMDASSDNPVVVIPDEAIHNKDFLEGAKQYLSSDKKITKFDVVLEANPYAAKAIDMIQKIQEQTDTAKRGTIFDKSEPEIAGVSSTNHDLQTVSDEDYSRTAVLMLIGIFIILIILLRSLIMPIYLIGSLLLTYFTSMAVGEFIFVNLAGQDGMTWAVPFFAFVLLMALGIDYSIFLMGRFNEHTGEGSLKEVLLSAMGNMGTVIISAAVILGGTFGAMLPSGVLSILQIATVVLTGLFLYAIVILPLFIPLMVRMFGEANWWPFGRKK
ncbi:efflux RND transporter permease subunit [Virgibacillus halophilus]|uniref:efflux RND transporter permease subunit n=1 Tax=Tigheibacillus halophilus TaxID=361280 RepID=UPI00362C6CC0